MGAAREELMNQIAARFEEENPGITISNLVQPFENRAENLFAALNSGDPPEVLMAARAEILKFASDGLIVPITAMVESHNLDLNVFYPSEIGNFYWEGELYSMPMPTGGGITGLELVNLDLFNDAGKEGVIPQTWAELEEVAKEFTEVDDKGILKIGANPGTGVSDFLPGSTATTARSTAKICAAWHLTPRPASPRWSGWSTLPMRSTAACRM
ncbi:MAG: extracellular solute-binding protein [Caldilineaceae bacterium]